MLMAWLKNRALMPNAELPAVQSSAYWRDYFRANAEALHDVPWQDGARITPEELAEIVESLRAWQLGETSNGAHLLAAARKYAERHHDPDFVEAIQCFIVEEQRHGETLGRFLDLAGATRAQSDWGDSLFRKARYFLGNMETWTTPVVMIETHALLYYNAIRRATQSPVLRKICEQILRDEIPHIRFQCERLAILHKDRPRLLHAATMMLHRVFFTGITLTVWLAHRRALRAGGYDFVRFWRGAWTRMNHAWKQMNPRGYQWVCALPAQAPSSPAGLCEL